MVHDDRCELSRIGSKSCSCATRAYEKDPLPGVVNPYVIRMDDDELGEWMAH